MSNIYYPHEQKHYSVIKCLHMQSNMDLGMLMNKKDINTAFICYNSYYEKCMIYVVAFQAS